MYKLTIEFETKEHLLTFLNGDSLTIQVSSEGETMISTLKKKAPARKKAKKNEVTLNDNKTTLNASEKPLEEPTNTPTMTDTTTVDQKSTKVETSGQAEVETNELTYEDDVRPAGLKLANTEGKGRDALLELFDQFGVANGKELEAGQFQDFIDAIEAKIVE